MKIRCGSHQQNRSIVRPGLSLMATKVALTAEEFRENSQRSIDLFNTEKLSTDSTHVLKSAYCILCISAVAICTERVEAKLLCVQRRLFQNGLQSARSVWRQSTRFTRFRNPCSLQSARSVWRQRVHQRRAWQARPVAICTERVEAKSSSRTYCSFSVRCNLHGACGGKGSRHSCKWSALCCNLHGACGGKGVGYDNALVGVVLQSARSVWRQRTRLHHQCW